MKVDGLEARVAKLEYALEQTIQSFTKFQQVAIGVDNLPPKIALEISRTALHIASVAQKAHSGEPLSEVEADNSGSGKSQDSQDTTKDVVEKPVIRQIGPIETARVSSPSNPPTTSAPTNDFTSFDLVKSPLPMNISSTISTQQNQAPRHSGSMRRPWFPARLLRLCLEKGVQLLTSPNMTYGDLHPALSIHLTWVTVDELRIQSVRAMANNFEQSLEDPPAAVTLIHPNMYRSIEGNDDILVPRMPTLEPQPLVHGRTRTKLDTNLHDFQGEWLEPSDVWEYLDWKGIFLGSQGPSRVLQIAIPQRTVADIWTQDAGAIFTEEIQRSRLMSTSWPFGIELQDSGLRLQDVTVTQPERSHVPISETDIDLLVTSHPEHSSAPRAVPEYQIQSNGAQYSFSGEFYPPKYAEQLVSVTLNLEVLMRFLVGAACCIGPGPGIRKEAVDHALRVSIVAF